MSPMGFTMHRQKYYDDQESDVDYYSEGMYSEGGRTRIKPVPIWLCVFLVVSCITLFSIRRILTTEFFKIIIWVMLYSIKHYLASKNYRVFQIIANRINIKDGKRDEVG